MGAVLEGSCAQLIHHAFTQVYQLADYTEGFILDHEDTAVNDKYFSFLKVTRRDTGLLALMPLYREPLWPI